MGTEVLAHRVGGLGDRRVHPDVGASQDDLAVHDPHRRGRGAPACTRGSIRDRRDAELDMGATQSWRPDRSWSEVPLDDAPDVRRDRRSSSRNDLAPHAVGGASAGVSPDPSEGGAILRPPLRAWSRVVRGVLLSPDEAARYRAIGEISPNTCTTPCAPIGSGRCFRRRSSSSCSGIPSIGRTPSTGSSSSGATSEDRSRSSSERGREHSRWVLQRAPHEVPPAVPSRPAPPARLPRRRSPKGAPCAPISLPSSA